MKRNVIHTISLLLIMACSTSASDQTIPDNSEDNSNNDNPNNTSQWSIPLRDVKDGGPGKDGIPSIDNPQFLDVNRIDFLNDDDLVVGTITGNTVKAYPHPILDWHEIVNDETNNEALTLNYCPLTGTAFGWKSEANGIKTTFGVSGLLYNANLILYDRNTDSNWSQLKLECVNGSLIGDKPILTNIIETNWKTWKTLYPNSKVLSTDTGYSRNYSTYPYGPYKTNHSYFIFTPTITNDALPNKERIYALINNDKSKIYQFTRFTNGNIIRDNFNGKNYLLVGNENLIKAFVLSETQSSLTFTYDFNNSEGFFKDNEGNKWSVFGNAIEGPRSGEQLTPAVSVVSYWFAITAFYPNPEIYSP
ncbi:DUF3179 domain-containing protein [Aestuariivivens insulae]|uniref:DUF3179 domain-containing protein n=1 Tax=Aestuariivivens insulae TaxID=1621988 RepID=UPI001F594455|nr:DUF3179 domain-containing protein [Aestuariivivens insulae]